MKDLEVEFGQVEVKNINTYMFSDEVWMKNFDINVGDNDQIFPFYMSLKIEDEQKGR